MPTVSVIIPTYNRARLVTKAIDSVLSQTYTDYEIIVVDDGSTDNTHLALESYISRINYIYQPNSGPSAARNTGIRASKGKWIAFLDSDDSWVPQKLFRQMELLTRVPVKVCLTNIFWNPKVTEEKKEQEHFHEKKTIEQIFHQPLELLFLRPSMYNVLSTILIDRDLLIKAGCFDERMKRGEDTRLLTRLAFETPFAYIDEPLVIFDRTSAIERITAQKNFELDKNACYNAIITRLETYLVYNGENKRILKELRRQLAHYISRLAIMESLSKNDYHARRLAWDGIHFSIEPRPFMRCCAVLFFPSLVRWSHRKRKE
jgi:glycosyltransferase involved in cell wall biosynthesis